MRSSAPNIPVCWIVLPRKTEAAAEIAKKVVYSDMTAKEYLLANKMFTEEEIDRILDPVKLVYPIKVDEPKDE